MGLKLGSLFDGIGSFPLAATMHGIEPVWASEIEKFPIAVTSKHFPQMKHLGDITKINGAEIEPVDIITFGSPCQDLSVAGKRDGLEGKRSNLFYQAVRIIREMREATNGKYPTFAIWENVPGAFSSNKGQDIQTVLDLLQDSGYVLDMNVLDAQYMGVPQRRKRVFVVCVSANFILKQRTVFSGNIIAQCLTKILQDTLGAHLKASGTEGLNSGWLDHLKDGLHRKMNLFEITSTENLLTLQKTWEEIIRKLQAGQEKLDCSFKESTITNIAAGISLSENQTGKVDENQSLDMLRLWKNLWVEVLWVKNLSTTSIATSETTNRGIYTCALINLNMAKRIVLLKNYCPDLSETASSILTVMKGCISYAKQASGNLFEQMEWVERWHDYISAASDCAEQFERNLAEGSAREVFPISESVPRNPAESGEKGEKTAANAGDGIKATCGAVAGTVSAKWAKGTGGPSGDEHQNLVVAPFNTGQITSPQNGNKVEFGLPCHTLSANEHPPSVIIATKELGKTSGAIAFNGDQSAKTRSMGESFEQSPTLRSGGPVHVAYQRETLHLQAFGPGGQHDIAHALRAQPSKADKPSSTTYVLQNNMIGRQDKNGPQGNGINEDVSFMLNATDRHAVAYGICSLSSNSMKSPNPHSGIYEAETSRTLDLNGGNPACNQGGIMIIENTLYENHGQDSRITGPLDVAPTVHQKYGTGGNNTPLVARAFTSSQFGQYQEGCGTLRASGGDYGGGSENLTVQNYTVRRLTVVECLRLMGFPSSWFDGVPGYSDTAGYKACGNSAVVPCVEWIMGRIAKMLRER